MLQGQRVSRRARHRSDGVRFRTPRFGCGRLADLTYPIAPFARSIAAWGAPALAVLVLLAILPGCSELDKYWDRSPTGPAVIHDTVAPQVTLKSPSGPDAEHPTPVSGAFPVVIEASDDVAVTRVLLHVDADPALTVGGPPWELSWDTTALEEGVVHALWVEAFDRAGNRATSDTLYAQAFNSGPTVTLGEPADGALVLGTIGVSATIAAGPAEIEQVEFRADAATVAVLAAPPWRIDLDTRTLSGGDHFLIARARTRAGDEGVSRPVRIRVNNDAPVVTIGFPLIGQRIAPRGTLILSGSAIDAVEGAIPAARFTWTSSLDGAIGSGPYLRRRMLTVGVHTITARAVNAWGTEASASIDVEVLARATYAYCRNVYGEILRGYCLSCHMPGTTEFPNSQLDMKTYAGLMSGGVTRTYETIVPCRPESSLVWNKVTADVPWVGAQMPPRDRFLPLSQTNLTKLRTWIEEGAPPDDPETCPY